MKTQGRHFNLLIAFLGIFFFLSILIVGCGPHFVIHGLLRNFDGTKTGTIGDTFGGTLGPLIALLATLVTFAAFWVQYIANEEQLRQFERQSQNDIIFRLFDDQESRIVNSSVLDENKNEHKSYNTLSFIVKEITASIDEECLPFARQLICNDPKLVTDLFFSKLKYPYSRFPYTQEIKDFHEAMLKRNRNERWEYLKSYVGSNGHESTEARDALGSLGRVNFYKAEFNERYYVYRIVFQKLTKNYGTFLDGYLKGWEFICDFINDAINKELYIKYLHSRFSKYDKIILFYYLGSGYAPTKLITFFEEAAILQDLFQYNTLMIDLPSEKEIDTELKHIYQLATNPIY